MANETETETERGHHGCAQPTGMASNCMMMDQKEKPLMLPDEVLQLLQGGESVTVEFKLRFSGSPQFARLVTGLANSQGGVVIYGVDDSGNPVGLGGREINQASEAIRKVSYSLLPTHLGFSPISMHNVIVDGKRLLVIRVPEFPDSVKPIRTADGRIYRRQGVIVAEEKAPSTKPSKSAAVAATKIFVSMSFREDEEPALVDYFEAMKRAAASVGVRRDLIRIDELQGDFDIVPEIEDTIREADLIIADFTMNRPNVYYEAGIARGMKKRTIRTARNDTELHFDVSSRKFILYANATQLEVQLTEALRYAIEQIPKDGTR
ncbi:AlbA family DNA-binding domain-containing protein [Streptomyces roseochromogenus]|uniref:AlbA family DNA-binding domain-containing protein n=1 Tax=Streptomyces roseochromogenus TaxID=285450 RepID=UPI001319C63D|nr:ATP-binding protein [Streptomyces roseochromogenus]